MDIRLSDNESLNVIGGDGIKVNGNAIGSGGGGGGDGSSVDVVAPSADGAGKAADAKAVHEALEAKADKSAEGHVQSLSDEVASLSASVTDLSGELDAKLDVPQTNIALGTEANAGGTASVAVGNKASSVTAGSVAIGNEALVDSGQFAIAIGSRAVADVNTPIVIGGVVSPLVPNPAQIKVTREGVMTVGGKKVAMKDDISTGDGSSVDVVAEIAGKEIKPSSVVVESRDGDRLWSKAMLSSDGLEFYDYTDSEEGSLLQTEWRDLILAMPKYEFVEGGAGDMPEFSAAEILVFPHKVNHISTRSFSGAVKNLSFYINTLEITQGNTAHDLILVFDCYDEGYRIEWTEEGKEYTFHPRGGDAANLEVVAGKRNVFFITEVQPNQFMVARDELALPDAGGGE